MNGSGLACFSIWWVVPIIMMILFFLVMKGRCGSKMCGFHPRGFNTGQKSGSDIAMEIRDRRCATGERHRDEYQDTKKALTNAKDEQPE